MKNKIFMIIKKVSFFIIMTLLVISLTSCQYNIISYNKIKNYIQKNKTEFDNFPFIKFERDLKLNKIIWDKYIVADIWKEDRIYHFEGFYLEVIITNKKPDSNTIGMTDEEKAKFLFINDKPELVIDKIYDRNERMKNFWGPDWSDD